MFVTSTKGVKIHLHSTEVIEPVLQVMQGMKDKLRHPVFLHANLFVGPNMPSGAVLVDPISFKV